MKLLTSNSMADSSEKAFGGNVYLRLRDREGKFSFHLVLSKNRLAPVHLFPPRLELCGALVLSRLMNFVQEALKMELSRINCWTDSMIVQNWIRRPVGVWKSFVANRVQETQGRVEPSLWKHVTGNEKPADLLSRGMKLSELKESELWWHGPPWLQLQEEHWPTGEMTNKDDSLTEMKRGAETRAMVQATGEPDGHSLILDKKCDSSYPSWAGRFEKWSKIVRITARVLSWRNTSVKRTKKTWICLFVDANSREVHLELCPDMTTE